MSKPGQRFLDKETYESIVQQAAVGFTHATIAGECVMANDGLAELFGRTPEEILAMNFRDVMHPDDIPEYEELLEDLHAGRVPYVTTERRYIRKNGSIVWVLLTVSLVRDREGEPKHRVAIFQDITDRKNSELAARDLSERLQLATEGAGVGIFDLALSSGRGTWSNTTFRLLGMHPPADLIGSLDDWQRCIHPDDKIFFENAIQQISSGGTGWDVQFRIHRQDTGAQRWIASSAKAIGDGHGGLRVVGIATDITERHEAEELRLAAQQARLAMLRYQLNPHFLFNALNSISALIVTQRPQDADLATVKLSAFLRASLNCGSIDLIPFHEEISLMWEYVEIEGIRHGDALTLETNIAPETANWRVPPFLLQPLVENAIKHGVAGLDRHVPVTISAVVEGECMHIVLQNACSQNGHLENDGCGVGLQNVRDRLAALYGRAATLSPQRKGTLYEVVIVIPNETLAGIY